MPQFRSIKDTLKSCSVLGLLASVLFLAGCQTEIRDPDKEIKYKGPLLETHDVLTLYSDSAQVQVKVTAPLQQEYENGNSIFPKGLFVIFFQQAGRANSTLKANYAKFFKNKALYLVRGDVVIDNQAKKEKLLTEELYWDKQKGKIYTEKFVRIETPTEILTGEGLEANQDFSKYKIKKPTGIFTIKQ